MWISAMDEAELLPLVDPAYTKAAGSPQRRRREVLCFVPSVRRIHPVRTAGAESDEAPADKLERHKREKARGHRSIGVRYRPGIKIVTKG
jgi:hypothetical protein